MNILAFFFAILGAALNFFQPIVSTPVSGSVFTGSMYDAFIVIANNISKNGLPSGDGAVGAILIFIVLCIVTIIAAFQGLCALFRNGQHIGRNLFLCALVYALAAAGIFYVSNESFSSEFFANYILPYAQKISFITPALWSACYFIASVLVRKDSSISIDKEIHGPAVIFGIRWTAQDPNIDLDASAFLLDSREQIRKPKKDVIYHSHAKYEVRNLWTFGLFKKKAVWSTGDVIRSINDAENNTEQDKDLEQIIVILKNVPQRIKEIVFVVSIKGLHRVCQVNCV